MVCTASEHREVELRLLGRHREPEAQLAAALDHVLEHLVDRVLVLAGPARDEAADLARGRGGGTRAAVGRRALARARRRRGVAGRGRRHVGQLADVALRASRA